MSPSGSRRHWVKNGYQRFADQDQALLLESEYNVYRFQRDLSYLTPPAKPAHRELRVSGHEVNSIATAAADITTNAASRRNRSAGGFTSWPITRGHW